MSDAGFPSASPPPRVTPVDEVEKLLTGTHERIKADRGPLAWLRCRPTSQRFAFVLLTLAALLAVIPWRFQRPDFSTYPPLRMALTFSAYLFALALSIRELVRPLYTARGRVEVFVLATAALPLLLATLPPAYRTENLSTVGHGHDCIAVGMLAGFLAMLVVRAVDRAPRVGTGQALLLGSSAGLFANLVLLLHCPIDRPSHLLVTHAFLGVALAALFRVIGPSAPRPLPM
ncbi:MAG TPA: hypothetical protein VGP07_25525 [Polyangia bacterium]|jgi:hypothetical protein